MKSKTPEDIVKDTNLSELEKKFNNIKFTIEDFKKASVRIQNKKNYRNMCLTLGIPYKESGSAEFHIKLAKIY